MRISSSNDIAEAKIKLKERMEGLFAQACACLLLKDSDVVHMGCEESEKFFSRLEKLKDYGPTRWWLSLYKCRVCQQAWIVGEDQVVYDADYLVRISNKEEEDIIENNSDPVYFQSYEEILKMGRKYEIRIFWPDLAESGLSWVIEDLLAKRPEISPEEISYLLNIEITWIKQIYQKIKNANISFLTHFGG